jgi:hypothetical protein
MCEYLGSHPRIFISDPKEPHFFLRDQAGRKKHAKEYFSLFANAGREHLAIGEASTGYLYSRTAIANIKEFNKDARIIAMLRNPIDLVYSLHSKLLMNLDEDEPDFRKAWRLQAARKEGRNLPANPIYHNQHLLQYEEVGKLGEQVERLYLYFPREQVKLILFEDFVTETKSVYMDVLAFLNVPPLDDKKHFVPTNLNIAFRRHWLGRVTVRPPKVLQVAAMGLKKVFGMPNVELLKGIRSYNVQIKPREPLPADFREEMANVFRRDVEKLSSLIGRDLSHWVDRPSTGPGH